AKQPDGLDIGNESGLAQRDESSWRVGLLEQRCGRRVNALVGRLSGEHDSDQQFEGRAVLEFAARMRIFRSQALEDLESLAGIHLAPDNSRSRAKRLGSSAANPASALRSS